MTLLAAGPVSTLNNLSLRGQNASYGFSQGALEVNHVVKATVLTSYTPGYNSSASLNVSDVSVVVTNQSSSLSTTQISFSPTASGSFLFILNQAYGSKTLQISGTCDGSTGTIPALSMGGTSNDASIQVEMGQTGSRKISLGQGDVRTLANKSTGAVSILDCYGKEATWSHIPITTDSDNYVQITSGLPYTISGGSNTQITGTANWRRSRLTTTGAGTKQLDVRVQRNGSATSYRGDVQISMIAVNGVEHFLDTSSGIMQGWTTYNMDTTQNWTSASSVSATSSGSNGRFVLRTTNTSTPSSLTGRLYNEFNPSHGYGHFETSGATVTNGYYHARSPSYTLAAGDVVDVFYGIDAPSIDFVQFQLV